MMTEQEHACNVCAEPTFNPGSCDTCADALGNIHGDYMEAGLEMEATTEPGEEREKAAKELRECRDSKERDYIESLPITQEMRETELDK